MSVTIDPEVPFDKDLNPEVARCTCQPVDEDLIQAGWHPSSRLPSRNEGEECYLHEIGCNDMGFHDQHSPREVFHGHERSEAPDYDPEQLLLW